MHLEQVLLVLLFAYIGVFLLLGLAKGRKYLKSYESGEDAEFFFHHVNVTLALAGLAITALALFAGFGLQNLERVSSITLFFSISFVTLALSSIFRRFSRRFYIFISKVLVDVGILAIGCGFLVFFKQELPLSYELTLIYSLFIVIFLILSFIQLHKYYKYWSVFNDEKEKSKDISVKSSNSKKEEVKERQ